MTIHYPNDTSLAELRRVFALIQEGKTVARQPTISQQTQSVGGSYGTIGTSSQATGPAGPDGAVGPAGASGGIDPTLMVMSYTEEEDIIVQLGSDVITDEYGFAITEAKVSWEVVTDENGIMITAD